MSRIVWAEWCTLVVVAGTLDIVLVFLQEAQALAVLGLRPLHKAEDSDRLQTVILENSYVGIAFVRNRVFEWVNPRWAEILRSTPEKVVGNLTRQLQIGRRLRGLIKQAQ